MIFRGFAVGLVRAARRTDFAARALTGSLVHGESFIVGPRPRIARGVRISLGDRVNIGADVSIQTDLDIGDDVMISSNVAFIGNDHDFSDPSLTIQEQSRLPRSHVVLEGDNLIGFGTIVLGNVRIAKGAIVGAGSLVTHDLPPDSICVGRPAKPIRSRRPNA